MPVQVTPEESKRTTATAEESVFFAGLQTRNAKGVRLPAFLLALLLFCLTFPLTALVPPWFSEVGYFASIADKHQYLASAASPKIVFIGGSNLAFGLDSQKIEKQLGRPVANMGLCVLFELPYLIEEVKDDLRKGDIVVISPEYTILEKNPLLVSPFLLNLPQLYAPCGGWIARAYLTSPMRMMQMVKMLQLWYSTKWKSFGGLVDNYLHGKYTSEDLCIMEVPIHHARLSFNKNGDYFGHLGCSWAPVKSLVEFPNFKINRDVQDQLRGFKKWGAERGVEVVLLPPPIASKDTAGQALAEAQLKQLSDKTGVSVLGRPQAYSLPLEWFCDSSYHLNAHGKAVRTDLAISNLKDYIAAKR